MKSIKVYLKFLMNSWILVVNFSGNVFASEELVTTQTSSSRRSNKIHFNCIHSEEKNKLTYVNAQCNKDETDFGVEKLGSFAKKEIIEISFPLNKTIHTSSAIEIFLVDHKTLSIWLHFLHDSFGSEFLPKIIFKIDKKIRLIITLSDGNPIGTVGL